MVYGTHGTDFCAKSALRTLLHIGQRLHFADVDGHTVTVPWLVVAAMVLVGRDAGNLNRCGFGVLFFNFDQFRQESTGEIMTLFQVFFVWSSCP